MNIKQLILDAEFLYAHKRFDGALAMSLVVIGASSRKTYPQDTTSIVNPPGKMKDWEAFQTFLKNNFEFTKNNIMVEGVQYNIAAVLYTYYRCSIIHEGMLTPEFRFALNGEDSLVISGGNGAIFEINEVWILALLDIAKKADCNRADWGIKKYDLKLIGNEFDQSKYLSPPPQFGKKYLRDNFIDEIKKLIVLPIGPDKIRGLDKAALTSLINKGLTDHIIPRNLIGDLKWNDIMEEEVLTDLGFDLIIDLAKHYDKIEI